MNKQETFLLHWLSKEDFSSLGECKGNALAKLNELGFVTITNPNLGDYAGVSLSKKGWKVLTMQQQLIERISGMIESEAGYIYAHVEVGEPFDFNALAAQIIEATGVVELERDMREAWQEAKRRYPDEFGLIWFGMASGMMNGKITPEVESCAESALTQLAKGSE